MFRKVFCSVQKCFIKKNEIFSLKYAGALNTVPVRWKTVLNDSEDSKKEEVPPTMSSRYEPFSEETAPIILDIEEERKKSEVHDEKLTDEFHGFNLQRGVTGVFDIEELTDLLRKENAKDLVVIRIPKEFRYANYLVIVTAFNTKHMLAICEFIRKLFKRKRNENDRLPVVEGKKSQDWMALDMDNIIVHIFSKSARKYYDLESLWAIGKEFDSLWNKKDGPVDSYTNYSSLLASLTPNAPK